jgi:hypothetical protein
MRGVVTVALDDQEVALQAVDTSGGALEMSVCVVKKRTVALYRLGTRMSWLQVSLESSYLDELTSLTCRLHLDRIYPFQKHLSK